MPTIILTGAATVFGALTVPLTLMLAPRGGLSAGTAQGLVAVGSTSVERRIQTLAAASAVICAGCMIAVRALA